MSSRYGFEVQGIEPLDLDHYGEHARREFWRAVVTITLIEKDSELAKGRDIYGDKLTPISPYTRAHRRSWTGKADPNAPPLIPAYRASRTRVLLDGRAMRNKAEFFWRADPVTGRPWGRVLGWHREGAGDLPERDVIGLSPKSLARIKAAAHKAWLRIRQGEEAPKKKDVIGKLNVPKPEVPKPTPTRPRPVPKPRREPRPPSIVYLKPGQKISRTSGKIQVVEEPERPPAPKRTPKPAPPPPAPPKPKPAPAPKPPKPVPVPPPKPTPKPEPPIELNPRPKRPGPADVARVPVPAPAPKPAPAAKVPTTPKERWIAGSIQAGERAGFKTVEMDNATVAKITGRTEKEASRVAAFYYAGDPSFPEQIVINSGSLHWQAKDRGAQALDDFRRNWFSTDSTMHVISHEIGHGRHARKIGVQAFQSKMRQFTVDETAEISFQISRYAATDAFEFVAEVYARLDSGLPVSQKLLELFKSLGGVRP